MLSNKQHIFLITLALCMSFSSSAQSYEEYRRKAAADFEAYKKQKNDDFNAYRDRVNADFAEFMKKTWAWKKGNDAFKEPDRVPDVPPVVLPVLDDPVIPEDNEVPFAEIIPGPVYPPKPKPLAVPDARPKFSEKTLVVRFYETDCRVRFDENARFHMKDASELAASEMWTAMSSGTYDALLYDCNEIREDLALCDWAYWLFVEDVAEKIYGSTNESAMLKAWLMNQSGFRMKLGRSEEGRIHVLMALTDDIYGRGYWNIDGTHFYLLDDSGEKTLYISDQDYPEEQSLRLSIDAAQNLSVSSSSPRRIKSKRYAQAEVVSSVNMNMLDFYKDYPQAHLRDNRYSQWVFHAGAPVSNQVRSSVYPQLKVAIEGKSQREAADILLNFVQTGFEYKTDGEVWGDERTFFPDESMYYPYCDCEDRSILFSRLVRDLMGLEAVLLYYPGHLATAVKFDEEIPGDHIVVDGDRYLVCDPTYINASIGMTMPGMDNGKAVVIML